MPTIEISSETYEALGRIARPFREKEPEDVIVRLIREATSHSPAGNLSAPRQHLPVGSRPVSSHAGSVPHGSRLRAHYKGRVYEAEVIDGRVHWNGSDYDSLSSAAVAVIRSTGSSRTTENGWRFWEVLCEDGRWTSAGDLRGNVDRE